MAVLAKPKPKPKRQVSKVLTRKIISKAFLRETKVSVSSLKNLFSPKSGELSKGFFSKDFSLKASSLNRFLAESL